MTIEKTFTNKSFDLVIGNLYDRYNVRLLTKVNDGDITFYVYVIKGKVLVFQTWSNTLGYMLYIPVNNDNSIERDIKDIDQYLNDDTKLTSVSVAVIKK